MGILVYFKKKTEAKILTFQNIHYLSTQIESQTPTKY